MLIVCAHKQTSNFALEFGLELVRQGLSAVVGGHIGCQVGHNLFISISADSTEALNE